MANVIAETRLNGVCLYAFWYVQMPLLTFTDLEYEKYLDNFCMFTC